MMINPRVEMRSSSIQLETLYDLALHRGVVGDDFWPAAGELRNELLDFHHWKAFRLGAGSNYSFQTGITTGHIQGRFDQLEQCHRLERELLRCGPELCRRVGADSEGELAIDISGMAYGQGGRLRRHTDSVAGRRLAWILFLTSPDDDEWTGDLDGGALVLRAGSNDDDASEPVAPRFNRFAAFRVSDSSWHEIDTVRRRTTWSSCRLGLAGWIRDRLPEDP